MPFYTYYRQSIRFLQKDSLTILHSCSEIKTPWAFSHLCIDCFFYFYGARNRHLFQKQTLGFADNNPIHWNLRRQNASF